MASPDAGAATADPGGVAIEMTASPAAAHHHASSSADDSYAAQARAVALQRDVAAMVAAQAQEGAALTPHSRAKYKIDTGSKDFKYLSYDKVLKEKHLWHPRRPAEGRALPKRFPWCGTDTGSHNLCPCAKGNMGELAPFGVGVALYFKWLKYMAVVFFMLSVLSGPALIFYVLGGKAEDVAFSGIDSIGLTTIGNLGSSQAMCEEINPGDTLFLECPEGAVIGNIEAHYGQIRGSCVCPPERTPLPFCPGVIGANDQCDGNPYCHLEANRQVRMPSGATLEAGPCCSRALGAGGKPTFPDLNFQTTEGCESSSANRIVRGTCLGRGSCSLDLVPTENVTWVPNAQYSTWCRGGTGADDELDQVATAASPPGVKVYRNCSDGMLAWDNDWTETCTGWTNTTLPAQIEDQRLIVSALCFDTSIVVGGESFEKQDVALLVVLLDAFSVLLFLVAIRKLRANEAESKEVHDQKTVSAADYTVLVRPMPKYDDIASLTEALRDHFTTYLRGAMPVLEGPEAERDPIEIADIQYGLKNSRIIELRKQRGNILRKLEKLEKQTFFYQLSHVSAGERAGFIPKTLDELNMAEHGSSRTLRKVMKKRDDLHHHVKRMEGQIIMLNAMPATQQPVVAYITFSSEEGYLRCIAEYPNTWTSNLCMRPDKKVAAQKGSLQSIIVEEAPEPEDIVWENLEMPPAARGRRLFFTAFISLVLIIISAVLIFQAEDSKRTNKRKFPSANCGNFGDTVLNKTLVVDDVLWKEANLTTGNQGRLECFCKELLFSHPGGFTEGAAALANEEFPADYPTAEGQRFWCTEWLVTFTVNQTLTYGGAIVVLVINLLLRSVLVKLVQFERHRSRTEELVSRMTKLFIVQLLNTAFIVLVVNARIESDFVLLQGGEYDDFSAKWYLTVGVSIVLTMLLNLAVPHAGPMAQFMLTKLKRCRDRSCTMDHTRTKKMTQSDLEAVYTGPTFLMAERYAQVLTIIFVCYSYGTGLPLLYIVGFSSICIFYWVDKFMFTKVVRLPSRLNEKLALRSTTMLPLAAVFHTGFGMWMLSNNTIFEANKALADALAASSTTGEDTLDSTTGAATAGLQAFTALDVGVDMSRLMAPQAIPLFVIFLLLTAALIIERFFLSHVRRLLGAVFSCCSAPTVEAEGLPPYHRSLPTDAVRRALENSWTNESLKEKLKIEAGYRLYWAKKEQLEKERQRFIDLALDMPAPTDEDREDHPATIAASLSDEAISHDALHALKMYDFSTSPDRKAETTVIAAMNKAQSFLPPVLKGRAMTTGSATDLELEGVEEVDDGDGAGGADDGGAGAGSGSGAAAAAADGDDDGDGDGDGEGGGGGYDGFSEEESVFTSEDEDDEEAAKAERDALFAKYNLHLEPLPAGRMMVGLHSYDLRDNTTYKHAFALDSAFVDQDAEAALSAKTGTPHAKPHKRKGPDPDQV